MSKQYRAIEHWDRYWSYGNLHSFSQVRGGNYQGIIADFWRARCQRLAERCHVVDIAAGNGAIALLAREESDRLCKELEISAVDLANIDPCGQVKDHPLAEKLQRIRFYGGTPAESLPFEAGTIDLACSQFGVEYSDLAKSIPEIARVLRPGGTFAAVAHHQESILLKAARKELDQLNFVLNEVKLYLKARNLLRAMGGARHAKGSKGRRDNPKIKRKRRVLEEAMNRLDKTAESQPNPSMLIGPARYIREILSVTHRVPPGELLDWLEEALLRVRANERRLVDMTEAARSDDDIPGITRQLEKSGFVGVEAGTVRQDDGALLGWWIEAVKGRSTSF